MTVSRETADLQRYLTLLEHWSRKINLIGATTVDDAWHRHIEDSVQLATLRPQGGPRWTDLGSGGGLPGMVLAINAPDSGTHYTLIESDGRKATFLRHVKAQLNLTNVTVLTQRIEAATPQEATTVSARALAPLPQLMAYVGRHLAHDGVALLPKGRNWKTEVREAEQSWRFDYVAHTSATDADAAVLEIRNIHAK